jgi:thiol-disulfide isomerase/thioredoxin
MFQVRVQRTFMAYSVALAMAALSSAGLSAEEFHLGSRVGDLNLTDLKGAPVTFGPSPGGVTVVAFIATRCPYSNAYNERMNTIYKDYSSKGVRFLFINSNRTELASEVEQHARSAGFAFPVYKDIGNVVADQFGAQATPEMFVIDGAGTIQYHGYIDDSKDLARVTKQGLRPALDEVLAGRAVTVRETKAFGCTISRVRSQ